MRVTMRASSVTGMCKWPPLSLRSLNYDLPITWNVISLLLALDAKLKILLFILGMVLQLVSAVIIGMIHRRVTASIKALEGFK